MCGDVRPSTLGLAPRALGALAQLAEPVLGNRRGARRRGPGARAGPGALCAAAKPPAEKRNLRSESEKFPSEIF